VSPAPERASPGLRERKKAQTRAAIQAQALRLFREQGYDATTMAQIAEAADVSPSTLFRYFPTKEELVLWDAFDPLIAAAFAAQPAGLNPIAALRAAFREVLSGLPAEERAVLRERVALLLAAPPLRATLLERLAEPMRLLAAMLAERSGRTATDPAVRAAAGAVVGVGLAALFAVADDPVADVGELLDAMLEHLETCLPP